MNTKLLIKRHYVVKRSDSILSHILHHWYFRVGTCKSVNNTFNLVLFVQRGKQQTVRNTLIRLHKLLAVARKLVWVNFWEKFVLRDKMQNLYLLDFSKKITSKRLNNKRLYTILFAFLKHFNPNFYVSNICGYWGIYIVA